MKRELSFLLLSFPELRLPHKGRDTLSIIHSQEETPEGCK